MTRLYAVLIVLTLAATGAASDTVECAALHDSLDSPDAIAASGGAVSGSLSFASGVNEGSVVFGGSARVIHTLSSLSLDAGSLSLWVRRTTSSATGGIAQIGQLGNSSSLGLFYINETDLHCEMRDHNGALVQLSVPDALADGEWTHVVVSWRESNGKADMWLFINGRFITHGHVGDTLDLSSPLQLGYVGYYEYGQCALDEVRLFEWDLLDSEAYAEYVYSSLRYRRQPTVKPVSTGAVQVIDRALYVDGEPYMVKGVGYAPTPIGYWPDSSMPAALSEAILERDVPLLEAMNVNTIRTWGTPSDTDLLDAMWYWPAKPIRTIVGFWVPVEGLDYSDPNVIGRYKLLFRNVVLTFKDHPGLLAWGLGNELNVANDGENLAAWHRLANELAQVAYETEGAAYHPTILINAGMWEMGDIDLNSDDESLSYVDMWGHNTYFGWDGHCYFDYYDALSAKPLIFSEYGIDAWDDVNGCEYEATQAAYSVQQWRQIRNHCVGASIMAYSDEWWKAGDPDHQDFGGYATDNHPDGYSNEEWWGVIRVVDNGGDADIAQPRQVYYALADEFALPFADLDGDCAVNLADLQIILAHYGNAGVLYDDGDLDHDNDVDLADLQLLLAAYGTICE